MDYSQNIPGFTFYRSAFCRHCPCLLAERSPGVWSRVVREGSDLPVDQCTPNTPHEPEESTMASAPATCPPSAVADQIIPWAEVREGDLVLHEDALIEVRKVSVYEDDWQGTKWLRVDIDSTTPDGYRHTFDRHGDRYTAVRRYTEGPSEAMAIRAARLLLTGKGILPEVHAAFGEPLRPWCGNPDGFGPGGYTTVTLEITCKGCTTATEEQLAEWDRWTREGIPAGQHAMSSDEAKAIVEGRPRRRS